MLEFTWDEHKRKTNVGKHGIDFEDAIRAFGNTLFTRTDGRQEYGEERIIGIGLLGDRVIVIVFVERGDLIRMISARKANRNESETYYQKIRDRLG